jgi:hypothetical protein
MSTWILSSYLRLVVSSGLFLSGFATDKLLLYAFPISPMSRPPESLSFRHSNNNWQAVQFINSSLCNFFVVSSRTLIRSSLYVADARNYFQLPGSSLFRTADNGWPFSLGFDLRLTIPHCKNSTCNQMLSRSSELVEGTTAWLLWTRKWNYGSHKMLGISFKLRNFWLPRNDSAIWR